MRIVTIAAGVAALFLLAGCGETTQQQAATGAAAGLVVGGPAGAAVGGAAGAVLGPEIEEARQ